MQKGQKEYAQRKALELFDAWNDVTGCFPKFTSYYYEICAVINDAVEVGSMVALGVEFEIKDGNLTQRASDGLESPAKKSVFTAKVFRPAKKRKVTSRA